MDAERVARVTVSLRGWERDPQRSLCAQSAAILDVAGVGVALLSGGQPMGSVCASDTVTGKVEEVQYTLGEGPAVDACHEREPVLAPDLAEVTGRWPGFCNGALAAGIRAASGFPLLVGAICIGSLNLYQTAPGPLREEQHADALAVAHVVGRMVLGWQSLAPAGEVAWQLEQVPSHRASVHQATGMIAAQTRATIDDALSLLRAYAFAESRSISDVAGDVVGRRLRFGEGGPLIDLA
ncbi:MAG TPA: GAF and ANTAR domain-containing protein [Acidimicrobiia bacterium]|nr:GAF and ANTAR domain-containing protein [Acidimicrobiia bacterium]